MRYRRSLFLGVFALSVPFSASASGDGDLWGGAAMMVCLAQNPALAKTPLGAKFSEIPEAAKAIDKLKHEGAACIESHKLSAALCNELTSLDPQSKVDLSPMYAKYGGEIIGLGDVFSCMSRKADAAPKASK